MKRRIRRPARLLLAFAAASAAAAIPPVDPYQSYVDPGCLSFVEQPGSRVGGTNGGGIYIAADFSGDGVADLVGVTSGARCTANAVLPIPAVPDTTALGSRSALVRHWSNGNTFETWMTWSACAWICSSGDGC